MLEDIKKAKKQKIEIIKNRFLMIRYKAALICILYCLNYSCVNTTQTDKFKIGETNYNKIHKAALGYLYSKGIDVEKAIEIDTIKMTWINDTTNNDTINSYSREWGYLEAFDDIKHNRLALIMMGPPPDMTYWKLIGKYKIDVKLNIYERADSGVLEYYNIMVAQIKNRYGNDFFDNISLLADSLNKLSESSRTHFIENYQNSR